MKITDEQFLNMYDAGQNVVGEIEKPTQTPTEEAPVEANFTRRLQAYAERGSEILGFQLPVGPILNPNFDLASNIPEKHWKARDRYVGADSIEDVNKITARLDRKSVV